MAKHRDRLDQLDRRMAALHEEVGRVTNALGMFAESLVAPSIPRLFQRIGVELAKYYQRAKSSQNGDTMELDILGVGKRSDTGAPVVAVVEVASQLQVRDVDWCLAKLPRFFEFFEEYRNCELIGGVAGMTVKEDVRAYAEKAELVILGPGQEFARWLNRPGFVPKVWRADGTPP